MVFWPHRSHALVERRLDALLIKRVPEFASRHDLQVEVKRLGDVGEVLVLTAIR